jgi:transcriptional regulator with XRE-family HTH domain
MGHKIPKGMPPEFWQWLDEQLRVQGLNDSKLARRAGIGRTVISRARHGFQGLGFTVCLAIAHALEASPTQVLTLGGLLEKEPMLESLPAAQELLWLWMKLAPSEQAEEVAVLRARLQIRRKESTHL